VVHVASPLLPSESSDYLPEGQDGTHYQLSGSIFLRQPDPGAQRASGLYAIFLDIEDPKTGIVVKLRGDVVPDAVSGQLTATFDEDPQLPFSDVLMQFKSGPRAALANPATCGNYTTTSVLAPWSGNAAADPSSAFAIDQGCAGAAGFTPSLQAGTSANGAGSSSAFAISLTRPDAQQSLSTLSLSLPPGLVGKLAGVPLCSEAQAAAGSCDASSQIGHVTIAAGTGSSPVWIPQPGKAPTAVYLAGPYKGAPFSLSVVVPAQAGPFDLGTVVVRAALFVDPHDAHVSVVSDPIPTILQGVPLNVQKLNVAIDRPGFIVAPTSCQPTAITGTAASSAGASAALSSPFQVANCSALKFAPKFSASTTGQASKAGGASLTTKISIPANQGTQANIAKVKVELPKQLPSRLTTLQQACTSAQFDANPSNCPAASVIGHATVNTPLLPVPLTGPAIFVSHGGEAFPSLVMVLQGYGITVDLVGMTQIKGGITSTTFKTVPDVPFASFELTLPQGKFSALGTNLPTKAKYSFCSQKLTMPTELIAQNGAAIDQSTPIAIAGCKAKKPLSRAQKLAAALKACKKKAKGKRASCVRRARGEFGKKVGGRRKKGRGSAR
jgi:hypothetical protein